MAWNSCPRCGKKLTKYGSTLYRCDYCRAPYIIQDAAKYELQDAQRRLDQLKNKKLQDMPQKKPAAGRNQYDPKERAAAMVKRREVQELAAWAGLPMPPGGIYRDPVDMFKDYDLKGNKVIEKKTGRTVADFGELRERNKKTLWGIDEAWLPQVPTRHGGLS